ncbi:MAG TPA: hypothetical protein VF421_05765 [Niabella sp.]
MGKRKVIFFDSWKGGIHNYCRLLDSFADAAIEPMLLHLGSWGNEEKTIDEEEIEGLKTRDISYYKRMSFEDILRQEKPDLVLFLSIHTFAHRAFIRYCRKLNIPTVLLYHGLVRVQAVDDNDKGAYKINTFSYAKKILVRLPKLMVYTLPCYIKALYRTKASREDWTDFFKNIVYVFTKPTSFNVANDAKTTHCMIYANADRLHAMNIYGFKSEEITEVGNPDFPQFGLKDSQIGSCINAGKVLQNHDVVYIDTALLITGLFFNNNADYVNHLLATNNLLKAQNRNLLFKPHPETKRLCDLSLLEKQGVQIISNNEFIETLEKVCAVILEPTTLSMIPCLMGLPVMLAQYGKLVELRFGEVLNTYPRACNLKDLSGFNELLQQEAQQLNPLAINAWIKENAGPLPAEEMPMRVTKKIIELIQH